MNTWCNSQDILQYSVFLFKLHLKILSFIQIVNKDISQVNHLFHNRNNWKYVIFKAINSKSIFAVNLCWITKLLTFIFYYKTFLLNTMPTLCWLCMHLDIYFFNSYVFSDASRLNWYVVSLLSQWFHTGSVYHTKIMMNVIFLFEPKNRSQTAVVYFACSKLQIFIHLFNQQNFCATPYQSDACVLILHFNLKIFCS